MLKKAFELGQIIAPARDSQLMTLGYSVDELGLKALGVVIESGKKKSLIQFPELNLQIWMKHNEIKDVLLESQNDQRFAAILPTNKEDAKNNLAWLSSYLIQESHALFILDVQKGDIIEIWDADEANLEKFCQASFDTPAFKLSLGLEEMDDQKRKEIVDFLGERLLFERVLPSGMHKLEWSLYLKV